MDSDSISSEKEDTLQMIQAHLAAFSKCRSHEFSVLGEKSQRIHAGFVFYRDNIEKDEVAQLCKEVYVRLVRRLGGTKDELISLGWMDLGYYLGLNTEEINYINNTKNFSCPTDIMLQVYSQNDEANLGRIVEILLKLERLDVIEGIYDPLNKLADILISNYKSEQDQGYYSISSKDGGTEIIKPKYIFNNLPEVLQWNTKKILNSFDKGKKPPFEESESKPTEPDELEPPYKFSVLLTYSEDGLDIAKRLSRDIMSFNNEEEKIRVVCLENEKSHVITNPEQYIRHYFEEVDYVMPIITERYFNTIKSPTQVMGNSMHNIDCQYARFIYTLMSTHYINGTGCLNKKVRPVLAQEIRHDIMSKLCMYPLLQVWTWENDFSKLLGSLFSKKFDAKVI